MTDTPSHLLNVWAFDKQGHKVHPYKGKLGAKKGLYSVNFTNDTKNFQGLSEQELLNAIKQGRFRERGTIRMCRTNVTSGSSAFAPVMYEDKPIQELLSSGVAPDVAGGGVRPIQHTSHAQIQRQRVNPRSVAPTLRHADACLNPHARRPADCRQRLIPHSKRRATTMNTYINRYRSAILNNAHIDPHNDCLLIESHGPLSCHYAPFEHINRAAKIVLMGITPGAQQARNAFAVLRAALRAGVSDDLALERAKQAASFSGPMRGNLIAMLDRIGLPEALGIDTCAQLFDTRTDLVHFTSALRYPVFLDGKDYSGSPSILTTPALRNMTRYWLQEEVELLREAFWVPLGKESASVLTDRVANGELEPSRVLAGMPHPSGANAERVAYFLGTKARENLSAKTNPELIDAAFVRLVDTVRSFTTLAATSKTGKNTAVLIPPLASIPGATAQASRPARARPVATASHSVAQAEAVIAARLKRIKAGTKKVAGFETRMGRHLAIQRDVQRINVWTEDVNSPVAIASYERYPQNRRRHSNLDAQAPRVGNGRDARLWRIDSADQLADLINWYMRA